MYNFLVNNIPPKLKQEKNNLNILKTIKEIEFAIKTILKKKSLGPDGFTARIVGLQDYT